MGYIGTSIIKNMKLHTKKISQLLILASLLICLIPSKSNAVTLFTQKVAPLNQNDTVLIKFMIDTESTEINSLEGTIEINDPASIQNINLGGSIFNLWPNKPSLNIAKKEITFVGGATSGVSGNSLRLFTLAVRPEKIEALTFQVKDMIAYKNDGQGTSIKLSNKPIKIMVQNPGEKTIDSLKTLIENDKKSPEPFEINLGYDDSVNEGQYFISFITTDKDSGISHYEITEGDFPTVRSGQTYILRDQTLKSKIKVVAIDNAGNTQLAILGSQKDFSWAKTMLAVLVLILIKISFHFFRRKNA